MMKCLRVGAVHFSVAHYWLLCYSVDRIAAIYYKYRTGAREGEVEER